MPNFCFSKLELVGSDDLISDFISKINPNKHNDAYLSIFRSHAPHEAQALGDYIVDWMKDNWGCSGDAYSTLDKRMDGYALFDFATAWRPCHKAVAYLSKKYPEIVFEYTYYVEFEEDKIFKHIYVSGNNTSSEESERQRGDA